MLKLQTANIVKVAGTEEDSQIRFIAIENYIKAIAAAGGNQVFSDGRSHQFKERDIIQSLSRTCFVSHTHLSSLRLCRFDTFTVTLNTSPKINGNSIQFK